jgi:integrase
MANRRANGEGSKILRHQTRNLFYSKVTLSGGRRVDVYGKTKDEVKDRRHALLEQDRQGLILEPDQITLQAWLERWLEFKRPDIEDTTHAQYETRLRLYIPESLKTTKLQAIKRSQVKDMLAELALKGYSLDVRAQTLQHLRAALDEAIDRDLIAVNPAHAIRVRASESDKQRRQDAADKALTDEEMDVFLEAAEGDPMQPLLYTMFSLGLRRGEALGLRWADVDFRKSSVRILEQVKPGRKSRPVIGGLKTSNSRRTLTMSHDLKAVLLEQRAIQAKNKEALGDGWTESGFVFTTTLGTHFGPRNVNRTIDRLCKAANRERLELRFGDRTVPIERHERLGFTLTTAALAAGLGVSTNFVRTVRREAGVLEGLHWVDGARRNSGNANILWTGPGAIRVAERADPNSHAAFRQAFRAFKLPAPPKFSLRRFSSHACRHTNLTGRLRDGEKPEVVAAVAGHSNPTVTMRIYRTVFEDEKRASVYSVAAHRQKRLKKRR